MKNFCFYFFLVRRFAVLRLGRTVVTAAWCLTTVPLVVTHFPVTLCLWTCLPVDEK